MGPRQPNPARRAPGRPKQWNPLETKYQAAVKLLQTRTNAETVELLDLAKVHVLVEEYESLRKNVKKARSVARLIERARDALQDLAVEAPKGAMETVSRYLKQLEEIRAAVNPTEKEHEPYFTTAGPRVRFAMTFVQASEGSGLRALTATELMCLALLVDMPSDPPTNDRDEVTARRDEWRHHLSKAKRQWNEGFDRWLEWDRRRALAIRERRVAAEQNSRGTLSAKK